MVVKLQGKVERKLEGERKTRTVRGKWNEMGREIFRRKMGEVTGRSRGLQEEIMEMGGKIREMLRECEEDNEEVKRNEERKKRREWWDTEYRKKKREMRRELRKWRREEENEGQRFRKKKNNIVKYVKREGEGRKTKERSNRDKD